MYLLHPSNVSHLRSPASSAGNDYEMYRFRPQQMLGRILRTTGVSGARLVWASRTSSSSSVQHTVSTVRPDYGDLVWTNIFVQ